MKINSITAIKLEDIPRQVTNTKATQNARMILAQLKNTPHLALDGTDIKKYERYQLQQRLQKMGAKVVVSTGTHPTTGKPALFVRTLSEKEWKDYTSK